MEHDIGLGDQVGEVDLVQVTFDELESVMGGQPGDTGTSPGGVIGRGQGIDTRNGPAVLEQALGEM
jgi:hypothetical protein